MEQTAVHENHNPDLLAMIPQDAQNIIEIGCSSGALAREFKKISPKCHYLGVEIDKQYVKLAQRHCDECFEMNIELANESFWRKNHNRDCWIFGDTLEHLVDPWEVLDKIRKIIPINGSVVACIPNAQHWSLQVRLNMGDFRYESSGLLDRTHLRWFTRKTIGELFHNAGFKIEKNVPRIFTEPARKEFLPVIYEMAKRSGTDPDTALQDALPLQYLVRAIPL
jgi:ubiquinone/menaquinone biosynthesis C-methylase UbiE